MLLRFRVSNHRSIRDEVELSMISPALRTPTAPGGDWRRFTSRVAALYGANAAGKTNVVDALAFAVDAVRHSATSWVDTEKFPYHPFRLDDSSAEQPSMYELVTVFDGVRHDYGFTSDADGVQSEWLYDYPSGRRRLLYRRDGPGAESMRFGRQLPGENLRTARLMRPRSLYLSVAANANHPALTAVRNRFAELVDYIPVGDFSRRRLITRLGYRLDDPTVRDRAAALLRMADVGISAVRWIEPDANTWLVHSFLGLDAEQDRQTASGQSLAADLERLRRSDGKLIFTHSSSSGEGEIAEGEQSSGTLAWLSLAMSALDALDRSGVLAVDELGASLHPQLAASLVEIFKTERLNPGGAQLIFTTHDVSFLSPATPSHLGPDEVWFAEKENTGATSLFSLTEFTVRQADNLEKRYLDGRYGAVPIVNIGELPAAGQEAS